MADIFPGSAHVRDVALKGAADSEIWQYAATQSFIVVTKDDDFRDIPVLVGAFPKLVMIGLGNCRTSEVESLLRRAGPAIEIFAKDRAAGIMNLP